MDSYRALAGRYDDLTADVDYAALADWLERLFRRARREVKTVLDLACGTGSLTWLLAERGYETVGVDHSPDMLAAASAKCGQGIPPLFLCQPMERLDLYGDIDACVCCLDSVNYVTRPKALARAFSRVHTFLAPGGIFVFDARTPRFYEDTDGRVFADETDDTLCLWRGAYSPKTRRCNFSIDLFEAADGAYWRRSREEHTQFAYTPDELEGFLRTAGFSNIKQHSDRKQRPPEPDAHRIFFTAEKGAD